MALPGWNQAEIDKADRYLAMCKARRYDTRKFNKLCDQALDKNDWRVVNMIYVRDEFETIQRSEGDER
jgi:vacuolar-type H+-ATPase subunit I/STV1